MVRRNRLKLLILCLTCINCGFNSIQAQEVPKDELTTIDINQDDEVEVWTLQRCIDYALENNISLRRDRITAESTAIDHLPAKAALFPSFPFPTSPQVVTILAGRRVGKGG